MELKMKKSFIYFLAVLFLVLASCSPQAPKPKNLVYLDELEKEKTLLASQREENEGVITEYNQKKEILNQIESEDLVVRKQLIKKKQNIALKAAQLQKEIEDRLGFKSSQIVENSQRAKELLEMDLTPDELADRLAKETDLTAEEIKEVVSTYRLKRLIASAQTAEELEQILRTQTDFDDDEIQRIVAMKTQILNDQRDLREETIGKIHDRLVRNRRLNIESVFCASASSFDQLVLTPVSYPFDVHAVSKDTSSKLYNDFEMISEEVAIYPDMMLQLEGNCDYKGSNKYNKALGDRRWSGVFPLITSMGYADNSVRGISKGEECPTPKLSNDEAWRTENRRTDFVWILK
jgi:outer membrane protein OmpA-like peptidoglycan-associated protein